MRYYDNPIHEAAFERCIDVLAELIEKYADKVLCILDKECFDEEVNTHIIFANNAELLYENNKQRKSDRLKAYYEVADSLYSD